MPVAIFGDTAGGGRQAELSERDHVAVGKLGSGHFGRNHVMSFAVISCEKCVKRLIRQRRLELKARLCYLLAEFRWHRIERLLEGRKQSDVRLCAADLGAALDQRLVRFQHGKRCEIFLAGFDAGTEGGTGEQDCVRPGHGAVARQRDEPVGHLRLQGACRRQIARQ